MGMINVTSMTLLHSAITTATLRLTFQNKSIDPP